MRTVMRWERVRGLPVHRLPGGVKPGVYALKSELDDWRKSAQLHLVKPAVQAAPHSGTPAVAVLPFANLSVDRENDYFSDGLAQRKSSVENLGQRGSAGCCEPTQAAHDPILRQHRQLVNANGRGCT